MGVVAGRDRGIDTPVLNAGITPDISGLSCVQNYSVTFIQNYAQRHGLSAYTLIGPTVCVKNELGNVAVEAILSTENTTKPLGGRGPAPNRTWGAYSSPQTP